MRRDWCPCYDEFREQRHTAHVWNECACTREDCNHAMPSKIEKDADERRTDH